ncbi:MAG: hypothetical protein JO311_03805 [Candidatus Eremiobacteraeota bacterium]|nr:hypothetical protein [Candidatus Eremiobacteraeota bacterium]
MRDLRSRLLAFALTVSCAVAAGCNAPEGSLSNTPGNATVNAGGVTSAPATSASPIQHVVIVVQENRTFNDFFATFPGADGTTVGKALGEPNCNPPITRGSIALKESNLVLPADLDHKYQGFQIALHHGKMDGFDRIPNGSQQPECTYPYQYTNPSQIAPYWQMARQYTLAEHMFTTQGSDSFTAHQDLIRGGTIVENGFAMVDLPDCGAQDKKCHWGCDAPPGVRTSLITRRDVWQKYRAAGPFPCSNQFKVPYPTLRDVLDAKSVSWKYYVPPFNTTFGRLMSAFDVVAAVRYGPEWATSIISPQGQILNDITYNQLPNVSWVIPSEPDSDHPGESIDNGPSWVSSIVNAIGTSSYWSSTAIIVVWDDWGGLYDNLKPPPGAVPGYGGLGLRIPAIIISPYAKPGYISKTNYEFGSILRYIEDNWGLARIGTSDAAANSIIDCFNYGQKRINFTAIAAPLSKEHFLHEKAYGPIDDDM